MPQRSKTAWIVANRPERGYFYLGRADGSERAKVEPHPKGLKFTYDVKRGPKSYSRESILPGQYPISEVVRRIGVCTGLNADGSKQFNIINRMSRITHGLRTSGIWGARGRLPWDVPPWFFKSISLYDFLSAPTHSYRSWCAGMFSCENRARNRKSLLDAIKNGSLPLFHEIPGAKAFGNRIFAMDLVLNDPELWATLVRRCKQKTVEILVRDETLTVAALEAIDPAYLQDDEALRRVVSYGVALFADVPYREVRMAFALRHIWDIWHRRVMTKADLMTLPPPPTGFRWAGMNGFQRYDDNVCNGKRRWLARNRDGITISIDFSNAENQWRCYGGHDLLSAREEVQISALLADLPNAPLPAAALTIEDLAVRVRERLVDRYSWAATVGCKLPNGYAKLPYRRRTNDEPQASTASADLEDVPF